MECQRFAGCKLEFRLNRIQREAAADRAFHLDTSRGDVPGQYPYRWTVMKPDLLVHTVSPGEQHWFRFTEDEGMPGFNVHVIVFLVNGRELKFSIDERRHQQAVLWFDAELLHKNRLQVTVPMDDFEQDRILLRASMDEIDLPDSWRS